MDQYVYVMACPSLPHMVKIGHTNDCIERLTDINRDSALPMPFQLKKKWSVLDAYRLEQEIHKHLAFCRISPNREFFGVPTNKAIEIIDRIVEEGIYDLIPQDSIKSLAKITDHESLGRLIRKERKRHKLTQHQLAFAAGVGRRFIVDVERGKSTAQVGKVFVLLSLLRLNCFVGLK